MAPQGGGTPLLVMYPNTSPAMRCGEETGIRAQGRCDERMHAEHRALDA